MKHLNKPGLWSRIKMWFTFARIELAELFKSKRKG